MKIDEKITKLEKICSWKLIMMKPENKNKYECLDCEGYNIRCPSYFVRKIE
jgi:hypothetical protein